MNCLDKMFSDRFLHYLVRLYGKEHARQHLLRLQTVLGRYEMDSQNSPADSSKWSEKDTVLITYGDMVRQETRMPLATLHQFCQQHLREAVNTVHILPFFPYSSDDGFSVVDYREVDPNLGSWQDIDRFAGDFRLMFDLVLNHVSRRSAWFRDYTSGILPAQHYFIEVAAGTDLSKVVRPRSLPLLTRTHTRDGARLVWTTFSDDQIDLNFANPDVLFEFIDILLTYIEHGAGLIRMDAIAYLWKEIGTNCIHLPQTHQVVKLFRDILDIVSPRSLLITETNVPHAENISYFGNGDEADMVYQFSLPPLLLHALLNGNAQYVREWAKTVSAPPPGCTYFNFTASHDGIGVRPLEGIIPENELQALCRTVKKRGGRISTKHNADGSESPYELNITYYDALSSPSEPDGLQTARFLCSQTVQISLRGIPGIYFNNLFGSRNYLEGVDATGHARTINRQKWQADILQKEISDESTAKGRIFSGFTKLLRTRACHPAFHPDGAQAVLDLDDRLFGLIRCAPDNSERICMLANFTGKPASASLSQHVPALGKADRLADLISEKPVALAAGKLKLAPYQCLWLVLPTD